MPFDTLIIILAAAIGAVWGFFYRDIKMHPDEPEIMKCDDCPNYRGSIEICIFECEKGEKK